MKNSLLLIKNCGQILTMKGVLPKSGKAMSDLGLVKDGFVACFEGRIVKVGKSSALAAFLKTKIGALFRKAEVVDAMGQVVMPGLVECHTHSVFAGSRANEFKMKLEGKSYLDILAAGGGILNTVKATRKASEAELLKLTVSRLKRFLDYGVTTVEVKSGYGLDLKTELKMLDVAKGAGKKSGMRVVSTFLGAHVVAPEFRKGAKFRTDDYLKYLIEKVLPKVQGKAEFVDIFCEKGAFDLKQSEKYLKKAIEFGFKIKIHAEQINRLGGTKMAHALEAFSADHCDKLTKADVTSLAKMVGKDRVSKTVFVLLPTVPLYLGEEKYADGRLMIDAGLPVAVSTDYNPGSSPTQNVYLAMNLACIKMGLTVEEVLTAYTLNAAGAIGMETEIGSIEEGKIADIIIMNTKDYREIPYWVGENMCGKVIKGGKVV